MAAIDTAEFLKLSSTILKSPGKLLWTRYDEEADVLYINFPQTGRRRRQRIDGR